MRWAPREPGGSVFSAPARCSRTCTGRIGNTTPQPLSERVQIDKVRRPSSGGLTCSRPDRSRARRCPRGVVASAGHGARGASGTGTGLGRVWRHVGGTWPGLYMCLTPHRAKASAIGSSSRPAWVSEISTRGGISLNRLRNSSPSVTICCRCLSSTPALIPGSRCRSCTGRWGSPASASTIDSVQRSPVAPRARASGLHWLWWRGWDFSAAAPSCTMRL